MAEATTTTMARRTLAIVVLALVGSLFAVTDAIPVGAQPTTSPLPAPGLYHPLTPARIFDTRNEIGGPAGAMGQQDQRTVTVAGVGGVPATGVTAVALNVTVTGPTAASFLSVWPAGEPRPNASNLNYVPGQTVPNMVVAKVGAGGAIHLYNDLGATHAIVDVVGWFGDAVLDPTGAAYHALTPVRALDTRNSIGGPPAALPPQGSIDLPLTGVGGVPATGVTAVALNVTVTNPTGASFITVYPSGEQRPNASNLNMVPGLTVPNMVIAKIGAGGAVTIYNDVGTTDVIVDIVGYFTTADAIGQHLGLSPARIMDTRSGLGIAGGPLAPGERVDLTVRGAGGVPLAGIDSVIVNVTATEPSASSFVTLWPTGVARPNASNLNVTAGRTVPNMAIVKVGDGGKISIYNDLGFTHVIVDVVGYVTAGLANTASAATPRFASTQASASLPGGLAVASLGDKAADAASLAAVAADLSTRTTTAPPAALGPAAFVSGVSSSSISQATGLLIRYTYDPGNPTDIEPYIQCTATLIGLNAVVTAYHCTQDDPQFPPPPGHVFHSWGFAPGASGSSAPLGWFVTPEPGSFIAEVETLPDDYGLLDFYPPYDFVVIPFEPNAQATVHKNVDVGAVAGFHEVLLYSPGGPRILAGYAGASVSCGSSVPDTLDCYQSFCYSGIVGWVPYRNDTDFEWATDCRAQPGMSGGPSFELYDGRWVLAGIVSNGTVNIAEPLALTYGSWLGDGFESLLQVAGVRT